MRKWQNRLRCDRMCENVQRWANCCIISAHYRFHEFSTLHFSALFLYTLDQLIGKCPEKTSWISRVFGVLNRWEWEACRCVVAACRRVYIDYVCLCRYFHGPHICGDALDLDPMNSQILTGSFRKTDALEAISRPSTVNCATVDTGRITGRARPSVRPSVRASYSQTKRRR